MELRLWRNATVPHYASVSLSVVAALIVLVLISRTAFRFYVYNYVAPVPAAAVNTCKIACIGDSITYGMLVKNRRENCYPVQLGRLLGENFSVRNFGANGRAVQKAADLPYWQHKYFQLSSTFAPDVVLLMLGTNDSRKPNWKGLEPYLEGYRAMTAHYASLESKPRVYALTPPTEFKPKNRKNVMYGMSKEAVDEMTVGIKRLALELGIEVIDINAATAPHPEHFSFDGVHANAAGARHIAETVYAALGQPGSQGSKFNCSTCDNSDSNTPLHSM
jgi:acyl-CoA thioesterase I